MNHELGKDFCNFCKGPNDFCLVDKGGRKEVSINYTVSSRGRDRWIVFPSIKIQAVGGSVEDCQYFKDYAERIKKITDRQENERCAQIFITQILGKNRLIM